MTSKNTGILLINIGTPESPRKSAVRCFLREFLSDPHVINLPYPLRWMLLNAIILPFRTPSSTRAYRKVWTAKGSPLQVHSQKLQKALQETLGETYDVELAMRYGKPDIASGIDHLVSKNCGKLIIIPLYPQYSESTTRSSVQKTKAILKKHRVKIPTTFINPFYSHPKYIESHVELIQKSLENKFIDKLIFSYHGLPENHIHNTCHEKKLCDIKKPCPAITKWNQHCYRAQCYASSRLIAEKLKVPEDRYIVSFQSRLGKTTWIRPHTDRLLEKLANDGIKNIAIVCPSFVSDCLETLEEIDIRAKKQWLELGGKTFIRVPCLNASNAWVNALTEIILNLQEQP